MHDTGLKMTLPGDKKTPRQAASSIAEVESLCGHHGRRMWGAGSQSPFGVGSQSPGGFHGFSQEFGFSQSQTQAFEPSQSTYGLSQASQLSQPAVPECTECQSTEMTTTDDGDMVRFFVRGG